ncbi:MAG: tripartite tricarboxylate transporter substrate-binding protein [Marinobacter sp.]|uniref:Bug family tripartite tricarboxylate transporter substrate binding protein n=1 Tax=Marinobacter sp. TaxID=50741 RepID=UPI0034A006FC
MKYSLKHSLIAKAAAFGLAMSLTASVMAETAEEFYSSNDVTFIISSSPGGGYDTLGRLMAKHLPKHIPGSPDIIVQNMPGAGGIVATTYLYNIAEKDGSVIGGLQNNAPFEALFGNEVDYDALKFNWLGTPSVETGLLVVWHEVDVDNIEDVRQNKITVASSGVNSTPSFYTRIINELLDTQIEDIPGYKGQNDSFLAMERGEVDGYPSVFYGSLMSTRGEWVEQGLVKLLLQYGPQPEPAIPEVPFLADLITDEDDLALLEVAFAPLTLGRPYLMPPGVPADRLAAMRQAFEDTFVDPEFLSEAKAIGLSTGAPRTGAEINAFMDRVFNTSPEIIERMVRIYDPSR